MLVPVFARAGLWSPQTKQQIVVCPSHPVIESEKKDGQLDKKGSTAAVDE